MKKLLLLPLAGATMLPAQVQVSLETLAPVYTDTVVSDGLYGLGFYPRFAPPRYSQQELDEALIGVPEGGDATLLETRTRQLMDRRVTSTTDVLHLGGHVFGIDFTGDPFDPTSWTPVAPGVLPMTRTSRSEIDREFNELIFQEFVRKERSTGNKTVDAAIWSYVVPGDVVTTTSHTLLYTPDTVPAHIPAASVQAALTSGSPGDQVALASGTCLLEAETTTVFEEQVVEAFDPVPFVDYLGDPNDYSTWIALGTGSIIVNVQQRYRRGPRVFDQTLDYVLVIPDGSGSVFINPVRTEVVQVVELLQSWDRSWVTLDSLPPEADPGDAATAAAKIGPGEHTALLHQWTDTCQEPVVSLTSGVDANGAQPGIDYSGDPADPTTWTALGSDDIIADQFDYRTLTEDRTRDHAIVTLYRDSDPTGPGTVHLIDNHVVGRRTSTITKRCIDIEIDPLNPPPAVRADDIATGLQWLEAGESGIIQREVTRHVLASTELPLPSFTDTNQWSLGVDFTGDPENPATWTALGTEDVFIDLYHPVHVTESVEEVCTNYRLTAPPGHVPSLPQPELIPNGDPHDPQPHVLLKWHSPLGTATDLSTGPSPDTLLPLGQLRRARSTTTCRTWYAPAGEPLPTRHFFRLSRP